MPREAFAADWAFSISSAIEDAVRRHFPGDLRQWPLVQQFDFEAFDLCGSHFVIVLRDKLSGISVGEGTLAAFPLAEHPPLPPTVANIERWMAFLYDGFGLRPEDAALVLPIHDSGRSDPRADYALFSAEERAIWHTQFRAVIERQRKLIESHRHQPSTTPGQIHYNLFGANSRVNIDSVDRSSNVVNEAPPELFEHLLAAVRSAQTSADAIEQVAASVETLRSQFGTPRFVESYQSFMSVLADHMQVFGPVVAPYLPALAQLLTR